MIESMARKALKPLSIKTKDRLAKALSRVPILNRHPLLAMYRWVRKEYSPFGRRQRQEIYLSIARFAHINRPIEGYYFEFGCHEANTMRQAWKNFRHLFDWTYVAFDSFEGLPEMDDFERSSIFRPGYLSTSEEYFRKKVTGCGMPDDKLITVKGFYENTLTDELRDRLQPQKAAVIYVDCDLYSSTVDVLKFIRPFLQMGTIVVFDDWNCYHADPQNGERLAWAEFLERHPELAFEDFMITAEAKAFICVNPGE